MTALATRRKVALLGNHTPRQCGIATFTSDLRDALDTEFPDVDCFVLAMNDAHQQHVYPPRVRFEIGENDVAAYGSFAMLHRPIADSGAHIWISFSPDLRTWGGHKLMLEARKGGWWDANKVGLSPPLIETSRGWLMIYHGVRHTGAGHLYRLGLALFALDAPEHCLLRGAPWIFGPTAPYEREGDVGYVAFPCGYTVGDDGDVLNLYYGAADTSIALATGSIGEMLRWLDANGSPPAA